MERERHRPVAPNGSLSRLRERVGVRAFAETLTPTLSRKRERGRNIAARRVSRRLRSRSSGAPVRAGSGAGRPAMGGVEAATWQLTLPPTASSAIAARRIVGARQIESAVVG